MLKSSSAVFVLVALGVSGSGALGFADDAQAVVGEEVVLEPAPGGGTQLTPAARYVVSDPAFQLEDDLLSKALRRARFRSGVMTLAGKVLPFGAVLTAYEVCNLVLHPGCWLFEKTAEDSPERADWRYTATGITHTAYSGDIPVPADHYYVFPPRVHLEDMHPDCESSSQRPRPTAPGSFPIIAPGSELCRHEDNLRIWFYGATRSTSAVDASQNISITPTSDTAIPNYSGSGYCPSVPPGYIACSSAPPANWPQRFANAMNPELIPAIAHQAEPENYPDPDVTEEENDHRCDRSPGATYANPGGNISPDLFAKFYGAPFPVTDRPSGHGTTDVYLHYGTTYWRPGRLPNVTPKYIDDWPGWGYRHILAKHGWNGTSDHSETSQALVSDLNPTQGENGNWLYETPVATGQGGVGCIRRVVVDYETGAGDPRPRGIVTSFNVVIP